MKLPFKSDLASKLEQARQDLQATEQAIATAKEERLAKLLDASANEIEALDRQIVDQQRVAVVYLERIAALELRLADEQEKQREREYSTSVDKVEKAISGLSNVASEVDAQRDLETRSKSCQENWLGNARSRQRIEKEQPTMSNRSQYEMDCRTAEATKLATLETAVTLQQESGRGALLAAGKNPMLGLSATDAATMASADKTYQQSALNAEATKQTTITNSRSKNLQSNSDFGPG